MDLRITTPRLVLAPVEAHEAPVLHRHWTDPDVRRYLWDGNTVSAGEVEAVIVQSAASFEREGFGLWAIRSRDGDFVGVAGFWPFHEPPRVELVVSLDPAGWGQGFALEATRALIRYAFERLGWDVVEASADVPNRASVRLMERLAMVRSAADDAGAAGTVHYALRRSEEPS